MNKTESDLFKALSKKIQEAGPSDAYSDGLERLPFDIAEVLASETFRPTKSAVVKTVNAQNTYQISIRDIAEQLPGAVKPKFVAIYLRSMGFTRIYHTKDVYVVEWNEAQLELLGYSRRGGGFHVYNGSPAYFIQQFGSVNAEQIEKWLNKINQNGETDATEEFAHRAIIIDRAYAACKTAETAAQGERDALVRKAVEAISWLDEFELSQHKSALAKLLQVTLRDLERMITFCRGRADLAQSCPEKTGESSHTAHK